MKNLRARFQLLLHRKNYFSSELKNINVFCVIKKSDAGLPVEIRHIIFTSVKLSFACGCLKCDLTIRQYILNNYFILR